MKIAAQFSFFNLFYLMINSLTKLLALERPRIFEVTARHQGVRRARSTGMSLLIPALARMTEAVWGLRSPLTIFFADRVRIARPGSLSPTETNHATVVYPFRSARAYTQRAGLAAAFQFTPS